MFELVFDKATTRLAGYPYGKMEYDRQVKDKIEFEKVNTIVFPNQIEKVASSFTQGFFSEVIEKKGFAKFDEIIIIKAQSEKLAKQIHDDLFA